jgi:hypothetical protein
MRKCYSIDEGLEGRTGEAAMSPLYITLILVGLALVAYGLVAHGSRMLRALAIGTGVVIFLLGLALDDDPRDDYRRWRR